LAKKNTDILINILLDRSGSMGGLESDVIGQFNNYIKEQKALPGKALVSLVLFDDRYEEVYLGRDIQEVPELTHDTYYVRGSTAYLDALGRLVKSVDAIKNKPSKVVFVVNTDGYENSSHEFSATQIKEIITERQQNHDWQFVFIGAGIDALQEGTKLGTRAYATFTATPDAAGIFASYDMLNTSTTNYRNSTVSTMDMTNNTIIAPPPKKKKSKTTTPVV
jgi:hypothetical protein